MFSSVLIEFIFGKLHVAEFFIYILINMFFSPVEAVCYDIFESFCNGEI